jgi:hypothetical protein
MKKGSTIFARAVIYLAGFAALAVCLILLPELAREESVGKPTNMTIPFLAISYALATPFFVALYQANKLLNLIDQKKAFSSESIRTLQAIKLCAILFAIAIVIVAVSVIVFSKIQDPREEVTFIVTFGVIFSFVPSVIAVFIAVLQRLMREAVLMKSENDLIV